MKNGVIFFVSVIIGGIIIFVVHQSRHIDQSIIQNPVAESLNFSWEKPPKQSLVGTISSYSGDVQWESRTASDFMKISSSVPIQQGETIQTSDTGKFSLVFKDAVTIDSSSKTKLIFIQTVPEHFLVSHQLGEAHYTTSDSLNVSVRCMHLLAQLEKSTDVLIQKKDATIQFVISRGSITVAFNDLNNISTIETLSKGTFVYDDAERTITHL